MDGVLNRSPCFSSPEKLLQTRTGRCGEFSNLFLLFLRACQIPSRQVYNQEDHVWNEYWSSSARRWIHLDSCEGAFDNPLMYELGWGRKMSYGIAFGKDGIEDVSLGYVADWREGGWERRKKWQEHVLEKVSPYPMPFSTWPVKQTYDPF